MLIPTHCFTFFSDIDASSVRAILRQIHWNAGTLERTTTKEASLHTKTIVGLSILRVPVIRIHANISIFPSIFVLRSYASLFLIMCVVYDYKFWPGVLCIVQLSRLSWNVCERESCANRSLLHTYSWVTNRLSIMLVSTTLGNIAFENFTSV